MSSKKSTRSSSKEVEHKQDETQPQSKPKKRLAKNKVFYIAEHIFSGDGDELQLERFYHPGKSRHTLFMTLPHRQQIFEMLEFGEPRRSWLIGSTVCADGRLYLVTPIDVTFLALHHVRLHCTRHGVPLDSIHDAEDESTARLLTKFVRQEQLCCVADVRTVGAGEELLTFYKYNNEKTLAWLALKTRRLTVTLRQTDVHCGHSAQSQNYVRGEQAADDKSAQDMDYLRMACDIVGDYVDLDLYEQLKEYLQIPAIEAAAKNVAESKKRKSLKELNVDESKKPKLDVDEEEADAELQDVMVANFVEVELKVTPATERIRILTAKEKALAKGAKGSKSIASFFTKK